MADAAREAGATVRTEAQVERIAVEDGRASGVVLAGGEEIRARRVLSNADPKTTLLGLVDDGLLPDRFAAALHAYRCEGTSVKINLGVDQLPMAAAMNGNGVQPYHGGIAEINPTIAQMDEAQAEARAGRPALDPHIELCVPTVHDPSLAPEGKHVVTIDVNSQPYTLAEGTWDDIRDEVADRAIAKIGEYFPNLPGSILERQVLAPPDLERVLGISGGHALHGEMAFDQLFNLRPVRGWGEYRTPIRDLWICGAGTHPGGGVTGANGRNCAREVIRETKIARRAAPGPSMSPLYPPEWDEIAAPSIVTEPPGPKSRETLERVGRTAYAGLASDILPLAVADKAGWTVTDARRQRLHRLHLLVRIGSARRRPARDPGAGPRRSGAIRQRGQPLAGNRADRRIGRAALGRGAEEPDPLRHRPQRDRGGRDRRQDDAPRDRPPGDHRLPRLVPRRDRPRPPRWAQRQWRSPRACARWFPALRTCPYPHAYRSPFKEPRPGGSGDSTVDFIRDHLLFHALDPADVAGVVIEPILGSGGCVAPPDSFWPAWSISAVSTTGSCAPTR